MKKSARPATAKATAKKTKAKKATGVRKAAVSKNKIRIVSPKPLKNGGGRPSVRGKVGGGLISGVGNLRGGVVSGLG